MNRRFVAIASFIASAHFLLWCGCAGFLKATGFSLFTLWSLFGLAPQPHHSFLQEVAFVVMGVLTYPLALLPSANSGDMSFLDILLLVANSLIWGICIAIPIYALRQKIQRRRAAA
jgi:hypothetical protein